MGNEFMRYKLKVKKFLTLPIYFSIILVIMNVPFYFADVFIGAMMSLFTVFYIVMELLCYRGIKAKLMEDLVGCAAKYATVQNTLLDTFEVSHVLVDEKGRILWMNEMFSEMTGYPKGYKKSISTIFPVVTREKLDDTDLNEFFVEYRRGDDEKSSVKYLRASFRRIYMSELENPEDDITAVEEDCPYITAIYFFDETLLHNYIVENENQKLIVGQVYIDNYDEAFENVDQVKRSILLALVDRKVTNYFSKYDALVRKTEKDKFFLVFRKEHIEALKEDRFSILEEVKSTKSGNTMDITLSIGLGAEGRNYAHNEEYSKMAIDLALGRGGDQVVLKEGEKVTYFGGKSQTVEKNTRVKARVKALALRGILEGKEKVIIMGHKLSDNDAFGSAIGIYCAARCLDKKAQIVLNTVTSGLKPFVDEYSEENGYPRDMFLTSEEAIEACTEDTLVMVVDTNRPGNVECPEILKMTKNIVVFDHHRQSNDIVESPLLSYIEPYASSACEMVAEVLQYFAENVKLESREVEAIYAGILIDTNNFMTKTGVRTFEAAAYLKRAGADVTRVRKLLRNDMSDYKSRAEVVRGAEVFKDYFAISVCPTDGIESPTIVAAQAANELLNIMGIKASFVLTDFNDKIYVSSRSIDEINVQLIMEKMGGGGHLNIAGAQISDHSIDEVIVMLKQIIGTMINEGEIEI